MRKILSIFLSFLLLVSSAGITLATHYCAGEAVRSQLMYGQEHLDCGMPDMDAMAFPGDKATTFIKLKNCCENEYQSFESDDSVPGNLSLASVDVHFFIAFAYSFFYLNSSEDENTSSFLSYTPPLLEQDLPVLNQAFLL